MSKARPLTARELGELLLALPPERQALVVTVSYDCGCARTDGVYGLLHVPPEFEDADHVLLDGDGFELPEDARAGS